MYPVTQKKKGGPNLPKCGELLKTVYIVDITPNYGSTCDVPPFSMCELQSAMKAMKKKKSADKDDVVFEMFSMVLQVFMKVFCIC